MDDITRQVDAAVVRAGQHLLQFGAVHIDHMDRNSAQMTISGDGYSRTVVTVTVKTVARMARFTFQCRCFETFGNERRWCAHKYAAALTLTHYARNGAIANWQGALSWLFSACAPSSLPNPPVLNLQPVVPSTLLLVFSLQRQTNGVWQLLPMVIPTKRILNVKLDDLEALADYLQRKGARLAPYPLPTSVKLAALAPSTPSHQAAMVALFAHNTRDTQRDFPAHLLFDMLPLLAHALVFEGTSTSPLKKRLRVESEPATLSFNITDGPSGLTLTPHIRLSDDTLIPVRTEKLRFLPSHTCCCMGGDRLFVLPIPTAGLKALADRPSTEIPNSDKVSFFQEYLPLLAEKYTLQEFTLTWEEYAQPPIPRLYLNDQVGTLQFTVRFAYGSWEYPRATSADTTTPVEVDAHSAVLTRVLRNLVTEQLAHETLTAAGIVMNDYGDGYMLARGVSLGEFVFHRIPQLREQGFEVIGEEQLRTIHVLRGKPEITLQVSTKIDWFDLNGILKIGDLLLSLADMRRGLRVKDGVLTCPDGSVALLPEDVRRSLRFLLGMATEDGDGLRISRRQAVGLELALAEFEQVTADNDFEAGRKRLHDFTEIGTRHLPVGFTGVLRAYQQAGYEWLHFLHDYEIGGCLADDMGLGKTVQTLVLLQSLQESGQAKRASLIVMPRSLLINWQREITSFTPNMRVLMHADGDREQDLAALDAYDVVLTTYGVMLRDLELLRNYHFHYVILDEAQVIKTAQALTSRAACCLRADHRLSLTGTPVENNAKELWAQFRFLNPGLLGSQEYFRDEFSNPIEKQGDMQAAQFLQRLVYPFILRRTKEQAAPDLPSKTERLVYSVMEPEQRALYEKTRDYYRELLLGLVADEGMQHARIRVLEGLLRLRQVCLHPRLIDKDSGGESAKLTQLLETMDTLRAEGHKALIFSQFTSMLAIVCEALDTRGIPYAYLDGKTKDRQARVDAFQQDKSLPFFLISLKAGGLGLNLTAADYVLHLDPWWNPAVERQATDRAHRIGQHKPVFVYKFIAEDTVEEKIVLLQERKRVLTEKLISTESSFMKTLTADDIAGLFS